jgi:putative hydrolase of the HAD superfamily
MSKPIFTPFASRSIKNIIFDLGGVILNINYQLTIKEFENLGVKNFEILFSQAQQVGLFDELEKGLITPEEFRNGVRNITNIELKDRDIDNAWNAMLLDFPSNRLELLGEIKKDYRTFLLSNTNSIHLDEYNGILKSTFGLQNLSVYFDKEYYSHIIQKRKPDANAFEQILNENNLKPEETLFIDDSIQHVEGARKLNILAYHLNIPKGESIEQLFAFNLTR